MGLGILNQVGQGRSGVGHGVRAVADHKAVVAVVVLLYGPGDGQPVAGLHVGAVDIEYLKAVDVAVALAVRNVGQDFLGRDHRLKACVAALARDGAAGS